MADREIGIVVRAKDEATKQMADIANSMKGHFQTVSAASAIAGGAITAFLGSTLAGAAEAEEAQKQLEHAVLQVSHANQEQLESTMALADALEAKGVLDGDNIKVGLAQLSTFGLSNAAVQALGGSMADLAVNQFGVNASSDQLSQTANVLAKALNGQFGVLEKSGIRFTEAQQNLILTGTEMEKVAAINEGLAQNLKYTNEVALSGFAGGMAHLKVQMDNVTEAIGGALFPILTQLAQNIMPIIQGITSWISANPILFQHIIEITAVVGVLLTVLGGLGLIVPPITAAVTALGAVFAIVFSPIGLITVAIAGLTAGIIYLYNTNEDLRNKVNEVWSAIAVYVPIVVEQVKQVIIGFTTAIRTAWESDWAGVRTTFTEVWQFLSTDGLQFARDLFQELQTGMTLITQFINENWTEIQMIFDLSMSGIKLAWSLFWEGLKVTFEVLWEIFRGALKVGMSVLRGDWNGAWEGIKGIFTGVWTAIQTYLANVLVIMQNALMGAWSAISSAIAAFGNAISNVWSGIWNGMKKVVDDVVGSIMSIINNMIGAINSAINSVKSLGSSAMGMVGLGGGGGRALGGMVSPGTVYTVGENGPETFIPDQQGTIIPTSRSGGGGGPSTIININGGSFLGTPEEIGDAIFNTFKLQTRF